MSVLLRRVLVDGVVVDVVASAGRLTEVSREPLQRDGVQVVEGRHGVLLPGLHDHHLHLMALAAARDSVDCSGGLAGLRTAPAVDGWVRGVGADVSLDRHGLDEVRSDVALRVQHRSGALWMLNTKALEVVGDDLDATADVERDRGGRPTGRLFRYDDRLSQMVPWRGLDLNRVVQDLHAVGITGVTDATADLGGSAIRLLEDVRDLRVMMLGNHTGCSKIHLRDHDLPAFADLAHRVDALHQDGRPVAVHCVTRESLLLTLAVLDAVGVLRGDRVEHASVVPPGAAETMARLGVPVITQPSFVRLRGDAYLREVGADDLPHLYPYRSLQAAGVRVAPSSDAPYTPADPWATIEDAHRRTTAGGVVLGPEERVSTVVALDGYLSRPDDPGGPPRRLEVGGSADLCLLGADGRPRIVLVGGKVVHETPEVEH